MPLPKILLDGDARLAGFPPAQPLPAGRCIVGWREWVRLPGLGIARIKAKIDTGARTSALHAKSIVAFERDGEQWVRFDLSGEEADAPWHEARIVDHRTVRSSNGGTEMRPVIRTAFGLAGSRDWHVEISLTNRERMDLPLLVGRQALAGRVLVDADRSWLCGGQPRWPLPVGGGAPRSRRRSVVAEGSKT